MYTILLVRSYQSFLLRKDNILFDLKSLPHVHVCFLWSVQEHLGPFEDQYYSVPHYLRTILFCAQGGNFTFYHVVFHLPCSCPFAQHVHIPWSLFHQPFFLESHLFLNHQQSWENYIWCLQSNHSYSSWWAGAKAPIPAIYSFSSFIHILCCICGKHFSIIMLI